MTDKDGNLLWFGNYTGWGRLKGETKVTDSAYQPFRLQNQYADRETGLHYNFFRYYEPDAGRFVNQDPIGLEGGDNIYLFSPNIQSWIDPLGLLSWNTARKQFWKAEAKKERDRIAKEKVKNPGSSPKCKYSERNLKRMEKGKAPRIKVRIRTRRGIEERNVSLELHHTYLPQRLGSNKAHEAWNLSIATPWAHAAMDPFRHTGSVLLKILKGTSTW